MKSKRRMVSIPVTDRLTLKYDLDAPVKGGYTFETWPNCAIPDCPYKANVPESDKCCSHQQGKHPPSLAEYFGIDGQGSK